MNITRIQSLAASLLLATTLSACGSDSTTPTTTTSTSTTINGQAIAGAVNGTLHVHDAILPQQPSPMVNFLLKFRMINLVVNSTLKSQALTAMKFLGRP